MLINETIVIRKKPLFLLHIAVKKVGTHLIASFFIEM